MLSNAQNPPAIAPAPAHRASAISTRNADGEAQKRRLLHQENEIRHARAKFEGEASTSRSRAASRSSAIRARSSAERRQSCRSNGSTARITRHGHVAPNKISRIARRQVARQARGRANLDIQGRIHNPAVLVRVQLLQPRRPLGLPRDAQLAGNGLLLRQALASHERACVCPMLKFSYDRWACCSRVSASSTAVCRAARWTAADRSRFFCRASYRWSHARICGADCWLSRARYCSAACALNRTECRPYSVTHLRASTICGLSQTRSRSASAASGVVAPALASVAARESPADSYGTALGGVGTAVPGDCAWATVAKIAADATTTNRISARFMIRSSTQ